MFASCSSNGFTAGAPIQFLRYIKELKSRRFPPQTFDSSFIECTQQKKKFMEYTHKYLVRT